MDIHTFIANYQEAFGQHAELTLRQGQPMICKISAALIVYDVSASVKIILQLNLHF